MRSETVTTIDGPNRSRGASGRSPRNIAVRLLLVIVAFFTALGSARAQTTSEFWPSVKAHIDVRPRIGLQLYAERQNAEELPKAEEKAGATLSYRVKPLFKALHGDPDSENRYLVTMGLGYEYIRKSKSNGESTHENRLMIEATPRWAPGAGFLFLNRQRAEFRWNAGTYDFRYRFKVTGRREFKVSHFHLTPYGSGELFWDRNHHSWNENQYAAGVQIPFRRLFMLDTYILHQNCTTCSQKSLNAFGFTANIYFRRKK